MGGPVFNADLPEVQLLQHAVSFLAFDGYACGNVTIMTVANCSSERLVGNTREQGICTLRGVRLAAGDWLLLHLLALIMFCGRADCFPWFASS